MANEAISKSEEALEISNSSPSTSAYIVKRQAIVDACNDRDIDRLQDLANSVGGFLEDTLRQSAWPLLLGCDDQSTRATIVPGSWRSLPPHPDEEQVQKDVDRAFVYYPNDESEKSIDSRKVKLFDLIVSVLRVNRILHYFQGYHDIVQVFLLVLGEKAAFPTVSYVSLLRIRDYMLPSISPAEQHLHLIPAILSVSDPDLAFHISQTPPFFALSATLTLYAHEIQEYSQIARLYDFILAHEPVLTVYLFTSLIILRRAELLKIPNDDHDMLLFTLSKLPQQLDLEALIGNSLSLYSSHPPENLPGRAWKSISSYSVLKTSRKGVWEQNLETARKLFELQSKQLHREEVARKAFIYISRRRRPIISIGATVIIGMLSYWLRRSGYDRFLWSSFWWLTDQIRRR